MTNKFKFNISQNPGEGEVLVFSIKVDNLIDVTDSVTFRSSVSDPATECLIGANVFDTRTNLITFLNYYRTSVRPSISSYTVVTPFAEGNYIGASLDITYNIKVKYTFNFTSNPALSSGFQLDITRNASVYRNLDKTYSTSNSPTLIVRGSTTAETMLNTFNNFNQYNTNPLITHELSGTSIFLFVEGVAADTYGLTIFSNTTSGALSITGPEMISSQEVYNFYIGKAIKTILCRSPYLYKFPAPAGGTCGVYTLSATGGTASFYYTNYITGEIQYQTVPTGDTQYSYPASSTPPPQASPTGTITYNSSCPILSYDTTNYIMKAWKGFISDISNEITYSKTKQKIAPQQEKIYINLSNLAKEGLEADPENYVIQNGYTTAGQLGPSESKWFKVDATMSFLNNLVDVGEKSDFFFVLDGYIIPEGSQFLPNLLTSGSQKEYVMGSRARIHFKSQYLTEIRVSEIGSLSYENVFFQNYNGNNDLFIQSIEIDTSRNLTWTFNYSYPNGSETNAISTFYRDSNCKYQNQIILFKNRFGVLETLDFNLKRSDSLSTTNSQYLRSIVDFNGDYDPTRHTNKIYNLSGSEEITINTDWIPEYMNSVVKELMLSEEIYLFENEFIYPINKVDESLSFKTQLNDKLIQYTMRFKFSHNSINNIL